MKAIGSDGQWLLSMIVSLLLVAAVFWGCYVALGTPSPAAMASWDNIDLWFDADTFRVVKAETDQLHKAHYRNNAHPLYSLIMFPVVRLVMAIGNVSPAEASRFVHAGCAAGLFGVILLLGAALRLPLLQRLLAAGLLCSSSSFLFWATAIETYVVGALSIGIALLLLMRRTSPRAWQWLVAGLVAIGITLTNFAIVGIAMVLRLPWRRVVVLGGGVLLLAGALSVAQRQMFPTAGMFFLSAQKETMYIGLNRENLLLESARRLRTMATYWMVLPGFEELRREQEGVEKVGVTAQAWHFDTSDVTAWLALAGWWVTLLMGALAIFRCREDDRWVGLAALAALLVQGALHTVYGTNTFLYGAHALPLVGVTVLFFLRSARPVLGFSVVGMTLCTSAWTNLGTLIAAKDVIERGIAGS